MHHAKVQRSQRRKDTEYVEQNDQYDVQMCVPVASDSLM